MHKHINLTGTIVWINASQILNLHFLFETLGYFLGFRLFVYLRKRKADPIPEGNRIWILIGAAAGGLLFSRLIGALEDPFVFFDRATPWLYYYTSKTVVGGLLGGLIGVELIKLAIGEKSSSGDLFAYPLMFAMAIGRIGCFSMGLKEPTYGEPSNLPWALDLGDGIPRHPLALYEIGILILMATVFLLLERRFTFKNGIRFQIFMIGYLIWRFSAEFIKPGIDYFGPFGTIQIVCILGLLYYGRTIFRMLFAQKKLLLNVD